ncbi:MAG TPA: cobaltochelatase subunit CobT, partial [Polymorphobacter sp.]|nr:cobaltochelatase subunit CobT [Polymorphobacter sp.]
MTHPENPLEDFRQALAATMRALGHDPAFDLAYTADKPSCFGDQARVPQPARALPADQVAEVRGWADAFALRKRHHDPKLFAADLPDAGLPRDIFNAVEQARIEAIGSAEMLGVARNLDRMTENRIKGDPIVRARTPDEVPMATALGLIVRERLTGTPPPALAASAIDLVRRDIEEKAGADLDDLAANIEDQAAFAHVLRRVLNDLGLGTDPDAEPQDDDSESEDNADEQQDGEQGDDQEGEAGTDSSTETRPEESSEQGDDTDTREVEMDTEMSADSEMGDEGEEGMVPWRPNAVMGDLPRDFDYHAYTNAYDEIVAAEDLCDAEELTRLRGYLDQQLVHLQGAVT